ncbi:MAG: zinc-ribbon domain-containing protein [Proteobacteria bacterium]|nr:zinc-ribbon domain-containing protein [Pseudomonadota bacterium]
MHIVCPHCTTSYAVNPASFGAVGRTVRCSRCKETWLAKPELIAVADVQIPSMAGADEGSGWNEPPAGEDTPSVESPPIASEMPEGTAPQQNADNAWTSHAQRNDVPDDSEPPISTRGSRLRTLLKPSFAPRLPRLPSVNLTTVCAAMAAIILALVIWRADIVRLLPQTATFYRLTGLDVNLRGLAFKDVKMSTETVDGKPVLVVEGMIVAEGRKPVELPRLRFSVLDAHNTEIYAWNTVLEQPVLKPGEKAWFRSRLASPPPEGRNIDVRFFNRRDVAAGGGA